MTKKIEQKQTLQSAIDLNAWREWLSNPEYSYPIVRKASLSSVRSVVTSVAEGARQILGQISTRRGKFKNSF